MSAVNRFLNRYIHLLWIITAYLGLAAISTVSNSRFSVLSIFIFTIGILNLVGTYGLFKKKPWGWKVISYAAILSLIYLVSFLVLVGILFNLFILYAVTKYKTKLGGRAEDSLVPQQFQRYLP
jgi:hypothetical protein